MAAREAQLRESENRYRSIFQHSPLGVLHFDEQGQITDCNSKLLAILSVERSKLLGAGKRHGLLRRHLPTAQRQCGHAFASVLQRGT